MPRIGRIALFGLALLGLIAGVMAVGLVLIGPGDPLDDTRVVAVIPNPSGREAAVVYLHHISNFSAEVLAVKLTAPPFPAVGSKIRPGSDIMAVAHARVSGWHRAGSDPDTNSVAQSFIALRWRDGMIDVCPANGAKLIRFDAHPFDYDNEYVTLCSSP